MKAANILEILQNARFEKEAQKKKKNNPPNEAIKLKEDHKKRGIIPVWWGMEEKMIAEGKLNPKTQALSFFCPVYFPGQKIVKAFLDVKDEHGETIIFPLPSIKNPQRIKTGLDQMHRLGIKNPERYLEKEDGEDALPIYSSLPGIEGVGSGRIYEYIGWEAVMLTAFQIVPKEWLNAGDPYNQSYRFPGEAGYSPYWRIPPRKEFKDMRPDLAKGFEKTKDGWRKIVK